MLSQRDRITAEKHPSRWPIRIAAVTHSPRRRSFAPAFSFSINCHCSERIPVRRSCQTLLVLFENVPRIQTRRREPRQCSVLGPSAASNAIKPLPQSTRNRNAATRSRRCWHQQDRLSIADQNLVPQGRRPALLHWDAAQRRAAISIGRFATNERTLSPAQHPHYSMPPAHGGGGHGMAARQAR